MVSSSKTNREIPAQKTRKKRLLQGVAILLLLVGAGVTILDEPLPKGRAGSQADSLAREMMTAVNHPAWMQTGAVSWVFNGDHQLLWDRQRHYLRVCWGDAIEVLMNIHTRKGLARRRGAAVPQEAAQELLTEAWKLWANDSFWLNPISKVFDPGTSRQLVELDSDREGLLVTYHSGGVTPGDSYLWIIGEDGLPLRWKMWVSIIPIGGIESTWEEWISLSTGAKISTVHRLPFFDLYLTDVKGAYTLAELLPGEDPFLPLLNRAL